MRLTKNLESTSATPTVEKADENLIPLHSLKNLRSEILECYDNAGLTHLFRWQFDCLSETCSLEKAANLVYSAPTSAGKSLVAEILILNQILNFRRKAVYVLPFISVAREKMIQLQTVFRNIGIRVEGYIGTTNAAGGISSWDLSVCTIEKANSLINRLIEESELDKIGIIVVDELHTVGDPQRGYLLELLLTKLKFYSQQSSCTPIQIVGMSATLPNIDVITSWLEAKKYSTEFRPVPLTEFVFSEKVFYDDRMQMVRHLQTELLLQNDTQNVVGLILETVLSGNGVLIFCSTKAWCEQLATTVVKNFDELIRKKESFCATLIKAIKKEGQNEFFADYRRSVCCVDRTLAKTLPYGVAFHHAGLTMEEREQIERGFRLGFVRVLVATSTLSSGVNLPANRVIIRSPWGHESKPGPFLSNSVYKQMVGRAGRKGIDIKGESILMCKPSEMQRGRELIGNPLNPIHSCLIDEDNFTLTTRLKRAILEALVSGLASSLDSALAYMKCTLFCAEMEHASKNDDWVSHLRRIVVDCVEYLTKNEFIVLNENLKLTPTQLGVATLTSSLPPDEALAVLRDLQNAQRNFVLDTDLHMLYLVTPYSTCRDIIWVDWTMFYESFASFSRSFRRVAEIVGISESFLAAAARRGVSKLESSTKLEERQKLWIHKRFFVSLALYEVINETNVNEVAQKFGCDRGFLQSLQQQASTYSNMMVHFCDRLGWVHLKCLLSGFAERIAFGVRRELTEIVQIDGIDGSRARTFHSNGFSTIATLAQCEIEEIVEVLRKAVPFQSAKNNQRKHSWLAGHPDLAEIDAAHLIQERAKLILNEKLTRLGIKVENIEPKKKLNKSSFLVPNLNVNIEKSGEEKTIQKTEETSTSTDIKQSVILFSPAEIETTSSKLNACDDSATNFVGQDVREEKVVQEHAKMELNVSEKDLPTTKSETDWKLYVSEEMLDDSWLNAGLPLGDDRQQQGSVPYGSQKFCRNNSRRKTLLIEEAMKRPKASSTPIQATSNEAQKEKFIIDNSFGFGSSPLVEKLILNLSRFSISPKVESRSSAVASLSDSQILAFFKDDSVVGQQLSIEASESDVVQSSPELFDAADSPNKSERSSTPTLFGEGEDNSGEMFTAGPSKRGHENLNDSSFSMQNLPKKRTKNGESSPVMSEIKTIEICKNERNFYVALEKILDATILAVDFKFDAKKNGESERIESLSICIDNATVYLISFDKNENKCVSVEKKYEFIRNLMFTDGNRTIIVEDVQTMCKVCRHLAAEIRFDETASTKVARRVFCIRTAAWILNDEFGRLQLNSLFATLLPERCAATSKSASSKFDSAMICFVLYQKLANLLKSNDLIENVFRLELEVARLTFDMEMNGVDFDIGRCDSEITRLKKLLISIENRCYVLARRKFSFTSSRDVAKLLFVEIGLPPNADVQIGSKKGKGPSHFSTNRETLQRLVGLHELPGLILNWRRISHALNFYLLPLRKIAKIVDPLSKRANVFGYYDRFTATGRLIMREPSLQTLPKRFDIDIQLGGRQRPDAVNLRSLIVTGSGNIFVSADYSQLELRILAHFSGDEKLLEIFNSEGDVFKLIAASLASSSVDQVTADRRQFAKKICYGIIYGMGAKSLAVDLNVSVEDATEFLNTFKLRFKGIQIWISNVIESCRKKGFVETIGGRRRYLQTLNDGSQSEIAQAERQAVNTKIQGSAADIFKKALVQIYEEFMRLCNSSRIGEAAKVSFQMHDELIVEVRKDLMPRIAKIMKVRMESSYSELLRVKLPVKFKVGLTWGDMIDVDSIS